MSTDDSDVGEDEIVSIGSVIILTIYVFVIFTAVINASVNTKVNVIDMESDLLMKRVFYSPHCFVYSDKSRSYPGVIDIDKLNDERLSNCLGENYFVRVKVQRPGGIENYYNKEGFENIRNFCSFENKYYCNDVRQYVSFRNKNGESKGGGYLEIGVVKEL